MTSARDIFTMLPLLILVALPCFSCDRKTAPTSTPAPTVEVKGMVSGVIWTDPSSDKSTGELSLFLGETSGSIYQISDAQILHRLVGPLPPLGKIDQQVVGGNLQDPLYDAFVGHSVEMRCERQQNPVIQSFLVIDITVGKKSPASTQPFHKWTPEERKVTLTPN